jgi:23S rRNA pseudouridine2605 synthase
VVLTEGKNREIRKIMEYFGLQVNRLIRIQYGPYTLDNLKIGEWKQVSVES